MFWPCNQFEHENADPAEIFDAVEDLSLEDGRTWIDGLTIVGDDLDHDAADAILDAKVSR